MSRAPTPRGHSTSKTRTDAPLPVAVRYHPITYRILLVSTHRLQVKNRSQLHLFTLYYCVNLCLHLVGMAPASVTQHIRIDGAGKPIRMFYTYHSTPLFSRIDSIFQNVLLSVSC